MSRLRRNGERRVAVYWFHVSRMYIGWTCNVVCRDKLEAYELRKLYDVGRNTVSDVKRVFMVKPKFGASWRDESVGA